MTAISDTTCNAQVKKGPKQYICELPLNHMTLHKDGDVEWEDNW